ncbi:MAG: S-methyl-5-thioribose-1-phosphate isomerase, partial [Anaerolineae bacterium]|nr:S-methyl-5-thioribose-1-phosphate isomerase [Anaerolineae bacterium]
MAEETRTVYWENGQVMMINQPLIPLRFEVVAYDTAQQVADAIRTMVVRGAPAIGAAAGFGMALAAENSAASTVPALLDDLRAAKALLAKSRPTAVNLFWALDRCMNVAERGTWESPAALKAAMLAEAQRIADEDIAINQRMGLNGAELVPDGATIIHHCNTGSLATVGWGTALGVIRSAALVQGKQVHVLVDETRPRLQGARLTAWELVQAGIPHTIIADGASGHYMRRQGVDLCLVGADRIAANGDVANKIGTYNLAVLAKENGVPFYSVAPWSTVDMAIMHGDLIEIEERDEEEVKFIQGQQVAP